MNKSFWKQVNTTINKFNKLPIIFRPFVGIGLILIGIVGIILPVMPGWVFLIPGIILIFPFTKKWFIK
jgi:hypothetical protein